MRRDKIEIVSPMGTKDPIHRMKIAALGKHKSGQFEFVAPRASLEPAAVLVRMDLRVDLSDGFLQSMRMKSRTAVIMMFVPDFLAAHVPALRRFAQFVDVFLVPTPEMKGLLQAFTAKTVELLVDPIDFCLEHAHANPAREDSGVAPLRLAWFGYPESYNKSMHGYQGALRRMVNDGEIEFHLITRSRQYGRSSFFTLHAYDAQTFPALLQQFDACVLSHVPFDFSVATFSKSENKAVLAITLGLPVVASRTPAYQRLLEGLGLADFLFSSSDELAGAIRALKPAHARTRYLDACQQAVLRDYSSQRMSDDWHAIFLRARVRKFSATAVA